MVLSKYCTQQLKLRKDCATCRYYRTYCSLTKGEYIFSTFYSSQNNYLSRTKYELFKTDKCLGKNVPSSHKISDQTPSTPPRLMGTRWRRSRRRHRCQRPPTYRCGVNVLAVNPTGRRAGATTALFAGADDKQSPSTIVPRGRHRQ